MTVLAVDWKIRHFSHQLLLTEAALMLWEALKKPSLAKGRRSSRPFLPRIPFLSGTNLCLGIVMTKLTEVTDDFAVTLQVTSLPWVLLHKQFCSCSKEERNGLGSFVCRGGKNQIILKFNFYFFTMHLSHIPSGPRCLSWSEQSRKRKNWFWVWSAGLRAFWCLPRFPSKQ